MDKLNEATAPILAFVLTLGVVVMVALGQPVPAEIWTAFGVVVGFFFGTGKSAPKA